MIRYIEIALLFLLAVLLNLPYIACYCVGLALDILTHQPRKRP